MNRYIKLFDIFLLFCVFLSFFFLFYLGKELFYITPLSYANILRAMGWINGEFYWPGPNLAFQEGNLPGPLLYFLIIPPFFLSQIFSHPYPYSLFIFYIVFWLSLTFTLSFHFVKKITKHDLSPFLFLVLIWTGSFFREDLLRLELNALFSIIFHLGIINCLYQWKIRVNDFYLIFIGLLLGLGVQIHHSILFHLLTVIVFLITDERIQKNQFQWKYFIAFLSVFLLPQIPYFSVMVSNGGNLYAVNYEWESFNYIMKQFLLEPSFSLKEILNSLDLYSKESFIRVFFIFLIVIFSLFYQRINNSKNFIDKNLHTLFFIVFNPILLIFPFIDHYTNGFFLFLFFLIALVKWYDSSSSKKVLVRYKTFLIIGIFLFFHSILISDIDLKNLLFDFKIIIFLMPILFICFFSKNKIQLALICLASFIFLSIYLMTGKALNQPNKFKMALKHIYRETGWDGRKALLKVFLVGPIKNLDFLFYYNLVREEVKKDNQKINNNKLSGYFLVFKHEKSPLLRNKRKSWFLNIDLPNEIKKEIDNNLITLRKPYKLKSKIWLVPYDLKKDSLFLEGGIHNINSIYHKESKWSENNCYFSSLIRYKNKFYLCYITDSFIGEKTSFLFRFYKIKRNQKLFLDTEIEGYPLTITHHSRKNFHFIKDLVIEISCNKKIEKVKLLSQLGYDKDQYSKSLFAPIIIRKPIQCSKIKNVKKIEVKFYYSISYGDLRPVSFVYPSHF